MGQKQKTEKKKKMRERERERLNDGDNNGQATHGARKHAWRTHGARKPPGPKIIQLEQLQKKYFWPIVDTLGILDLGLYFDLDRDLEIREIFFWLGGLGRSQVTLFFAFAYQ